MTEIIEQRCCDFVLVLKLLVFLLLFDGHGRGHEWVERQGVELVVVGLAVAAAADAVVIVVVFRSRHGGSFRRGDD